MTVNTDLTNNNKVININSYNKSKIHASYNFEPVSIELVLQEPLWRYSSN